MHIVQITSLRQAQILYWAAVRHFGIGPGHYKSFVEIKNHHWERDPWIYVYSEKEWMIVYEDRETAVLISLEAER